jgi:hypothetical protein
MSLWDGGQAAAPQDGRTLVLRRMGQMLVVLAQDSAYWLGANQVRRRN